MKSKLLKAADVAGLTFLMPVIRLCYGDEPHRQLKEIFRMIVVPAIAIVVFLGLWSLVASRISTRSGQLPGPTRTADAAESIWRFHERETAKGDAYELSSEEIPAALSAAKDQLATLEKYDDKIDAIVTKQMRGRDAARSKAAAPVQKELAELRQRNAAEAADRVRKLTAFGASLEPNDAAGREQLLEMTAAHEAAKEAGRESVRELNGRVNDLLGIDSPGYEAALSLQTAVAEEKQFLNKLIDSLEGGRATQLEGYESKLTDQVAAYESATGEAVFPAARAVARTQGQIETVAASQYAKPYTLPMQILRSVLCVFVGFLLGVAIAIPIGVLCGLSPTFMSAMTPFIALFKPVSPIVWLPIALIVTGSFIPDPDNHWLTNTLAEMPVIGWMKINPAFIASASTVALCSLWATMTNTALGVASISEDHLNVARVLKLGFWERLTKIVIPSALPLIFAGMRISLGVGWMVLIAAELLASSEGIGKFVWDQFNNGASDSFAKMVVVVFVVGAIGLLLDRIMIVLQRAVSFDGAPAAV